ncbi:MAG: DUF4129 domain-containing protein [Pseudomonadota bacterium]
MALMLVGNLPTNVVAQGSGKQAALPLAPPQAAGPNRFRDALANTPQRTDGTYLPRGAPIDIRRPPPPAQNPLEWSFERWTGVLVLIGLALLILVLLWRSGLLTSLLNGKKEELAEQASDRHPSQLENKNRSLTLALVLAVDDPREGLHLFVGHVLERAAVAGAVPLTRSWTGREILRRLPRNMAQREDVAAVLHQAEPILFGDEPITRDDLETLVDRHKALFDLRSNRIRYKNAIFPHSTSRGSERPA